jgi:hypothetical protein
MPCTEATEDTMWVFSLDSLCATAQSTSTYLEILKFLG